MTPEELQRCIDALPREHIAVLPTGLQETPRLAARVGVSEFYVKRDDLTGVGLGGNKSRELEFILADARSRGCDVLVAGGGSEQSNHAVQCTAAANRVGMRSVMVLRRRSGARSGGNVLLDDLLNTTTEWIDSDPEFHNRVQASGRMNEISAAMIARGSRPYVLESSLHPLSVVSYVNAALEMQSQLWHRKDRPTLVYVTSEGATLGGLLLGARLLGLPWEITGLDWRPSQDSTVENVADVVDQAASLLGVANPVDASQIRILPTGGPAYGVGSDESWAALTLAAELEGLVLDPVYTAKGLAGTLADIAERPDRGDARVVFVHTGGVGALFSYEADIRQRALPAAHRRGVPLHSNS